MKLSPPFHVRTIQIINIFTLLLSMNPRLCPNSVRHLTHIDFSSNADCVLPGREKQLGDVG